MHSTSTRAGGRPLRRDARENRDRILTAARAAFAELGLEVGVEEIARRAEVGVGTLYRRFPTKDALVDAVFEEHLERVAGLAGDALAEPEPWPALLGYLHQVVALQARDRGLSEILDAHLRTGQLLTRARKRLRPLVEELIARAQASGDLRTDLVYEDLSLLLWSTGRVVDATRDVAPRYWERYLALLVDGLRADAASPLPRQALTPAQHRTALARFASNRTRSSRG